MSALIRREDGIALASAMLTLMVVTVVTGVVAATAIQASGTSNQTRNSARALAAANAGLQAATFRLSAIGAASTSCFTNQDAGAPTGGVCPGQTDSLGNGESYTYYVSPVLSQSSSCAGLWVNGPSSQPVDQRCVVSIGTANGVSRRLQQRIVAYQPASSGGGGGGGSYNTGNSEFPFAGIFAFGSGGVTAGGTFSLNGFMGSNGPVSLPTGATVRWGVWYYMTQTVTGCVSPNCSTIGLPFPIPLIFVTPDSIYASTATSNANSSISWPAGVTYNSAKRTVTETGPNTTVGSASNPVVLPSGNYNFCELDFNGDTYLSIAAGARVNIYIDSPWRTGSGCTGSTGNVNVTGNLHFINPNRDPTALTLAVRGDPTGAHTSTVNINNVPSGSQLWALISAPYSDFTTSTLNVGGAIVVKSFTSTNAVNFTGTVTPPSTTTEAYYPAGFHECPATPSGSDPNSGC